METTITKITPRPFSIQKDKLRNNIKASKPKSMNTLLAEKIREKIVEFSSQKIDVILEAMEKSATGKSVQVTYSEKFGTTTTTGTPNVNAAKLLLEHAIGSPEKSVQVTGRIGIVQLIASLDED